MEPEKNPEPQVGLETKCKISSVTSEPMDLPASPARQSTPLAPPVPLASLVGQTSGLRSAPSLANSQPDLPASPVPLPTLHPRSAQK